MFIQNPNSKLHFVRLGKYFIKKLEWKSEESVEDLANFCFKQIAKINGMRYTRFCLKIVLSSEKFL